MWLVMRGLPAAISVAVVLVMTAILWYLKLMTPGLPNPAFFYVLPITIIALLYGIGPALLAVCAAFACADYFLYDPIYSFDISSRVELGDLTCFSLLALAGVKCASELFRPTSRNVRAVKSIFGKR